jgi:CheY-like chemotaxis protein
LNEFIQLVADIIRTQAYAKNLQFICDVATELPETVCCDAKRLRQVLLNLLGNSVKFTDHGLAGLRVRAIHRRDSQARLRIEVEDSGVGIAADKLESIFLPFEQTGDASRRSGGTGLGLAISRQLLRLMGSDIHATSQLGKGSRFWFDVDMPITASESDEVPPQISATGYLGPRKTVLIADDVYDNRVLLVALFASLGFNTIEATNGEALLGQAQSARPDLIITDVAMPKMDGVEATLQLRAMPAFETLPVIAVSANVSGADRAQCLAAGVNAFLSKPIAFGPLLQQVGELLQLQWTVAQPVSAGEPPAALVAPPQEEIEILYRLAKLGNMRSLRERADHVSALGDEFRPFADRLRELADGFQSRAIVNLISAYM